MAPKKDANFGAQGKLGGMGGKYGRKAENLTNKELKAAGGAKAAATRKVDISQTKRDTTRGITLGPKGKPLTGKVTLLNGNTAVYKDGKRVVKTASSSSSGKGSDSKGTEKSAAQIAAEKKAKALRAQGYGNTSKTPLHLKGGTGSGSSKTLKSSSGAAGTPLSDYTTSMGGIKQTTSTAGLPSNKDGKKPKTFTNKANPTKGTKRSRMGVVEEWNGYRWVTFKKGK
jgi:hypothetical protein